MISTRRAVFGVAASLAWVALCVAGQPSHVDAETSPDIMVRVKPESITIYNEGNDNG